MRTVGEVEICDKFVQRVLFPIRRYETLALIIYTQGVAEVELRYFSSLLRGDAKQLFARELQIVRNFSEKVPYLLSRVVSVYTHT